jgi:8-amino-7-oxononanoate synthase
VIKFIKHRARSLMFTAAPPPASVAAVLAALDIIESEPERRARLWENTRFMLTALRTIGFDCGHSSTPVIPIVAGPDIVAFKMAKMLEDEGVFVNAVVSPASPPGRALIRTSYMATHTKAHLTRALEAFRKVGRELGLVS